MREALRYLFVTSPIIPLTWLAYLLDFTFMAGVGAAVLAQVYRFRRVSAPIQRQPTADEVARLVHLLESIR